MSTKSSGRPRAAAYLRQTPGERASGAFGTDEQLRRIEELTKDRGWELTAVFDDSAGPVGEASAIKSALERAQDLDKLVVARLDRLGRGGRALERIVARFEAGGVDVVSVEENLDTGVDTAARTVLALLAEWEPRGREGGGAPQQGLGGRGFAPATVIDVGAGHGTAVLLDAFPDAYHVLIEPLEEFAPQLQQVLESRRGELVQTAIGDEQGQVMLNVDASLYMSSIRSSVRPRASEAREVPITTLDGLLAERRWTPPFGLKLDTEGYEREVVRGAARLLEQCEFVLAEVSVAQRFEGDCSAGEFIALMREAGLELIDLLDAARGLGGSYADALFARH